MEKRTTIITKEKIGNREVNVKLTFNEPSEDAIKSFVKKLLEIYNNLENKNTKTDEEIEEA